MAVKAWRMLFLLLLLFSVFVIFLKWMTPTQNEQDLYHINKLSIDEKHKKVIMLMVDSLTIDNLDKGLKENKLPTIDFLIHHGNYYKNLVSSFPSMSVTIDSTLLTGTPPNLHHVPGLVWYSFPEQRIINYGSGFDEILNHDIGNTARDFIIHLNQNHLNKNIPTIYDTLSKLKLTSGSINGLIYRGTKPHMLAVPGWINVPTSLPSKIKVMGPDFFTFGALSNPLLKKKDLADEITSKIGFNNRYAIDTLKYLIKKKKLPDFLYVYLPDMDRDVHKNPSNDEPVIKLDRELKEILDSYGENMWDHALEDITFIIIGDSGQTEIHNYLKQPIISLKDLFRQYRIQSTDKNNSNQTDIIAAINGRMAFLYSPKAKPSLDTFIPILQGEKRIDLIAWKENGWIRVLNNNTNQGLQYKTGKGAIDQYQQQWVLSGNLDTLDITLDQKGSIIQYGDYPDVLNRLQGALFSHTGDFLIVTAKPGFEFSTGQTEIHPGGGSHGSLYKTDSLVPLVISGSTIKPTMLRMQDIKPYILTLINEKKTNK